MRPSKNFMQERVVNSFQHSAGKGKAKPSKTQLSHRFSFAINALKKVNLYTEA